MEPKEEKAGDPRPKRLALSLSGGGFRATLFHLGVVRRLRDEGLLPSVVRVGAVSGGSVLAAHLVLSWDRYNGTDEAFEAAAKEILDFVRSDVRGGILRQWIFGWPALLPRLLGSRRWSLGNLLQRRYSRLYKGATLGDLNPTAAVQRPQVFFYTTSLSTGRVCSFGRSGFMWDEEGTEKGILSSSLPVSLAVAASSAFPPLFPPIAINNLSLACNLTEFPNPQFLTDGGVYDNLGIDRLIWYHQKAQDIDRFLISDAEGEFDWELDQTYSWPLSRNIRANDVLMKRSSYLNYTALEPFKDIIVQIRIDAVPTERGSSAPPLAVEMQRSCRNVRTDLDAFSQTEISCLVGHAQEVARRKLEEHGLVRPGAAGSFWNPYPQVSWTAPATLASMENARKRKTRIWSWSDWASWATLGLVLVFAGIVVGVVYVPRARLDAEVKRSEALQTDVERLSEVARNLNRERSRPIQPGVSGAAGSRAGATICCILRSKVKGSERFLLAGGVPDSETHYFLQPSGLDGGRAPEDVVGKIRTLAADRTNPLSQLTLAQLDEGVEATNSISGIGPIKGVWRGSQGESLLARDLVLVGRTSAIRRVTVKEVEAAVNLEPGGPGDRPVTWSGLLGVASSDPVSPTMGGDAGAPVLTEDGWLVGVVIAGNDKMTYVAPIEPILTRLGMELDLR